MTLAVCIASAQHGRNALRDCRSIKSIRLTPPRSTSTHGENKLRTKWPWRFTYCSIFSRGHTFYPQQRREHDTGERGGAKKKKENSITQRLEKQAGELLGRRDCHVCINRH